MDDALAAAIAETQEQLGGLFQKPKLSEKLLSKPPFRFLHDIVSAVTASTGFAAGLYSGEELDSGSIKDKAAKISYLDKIVALIGICSARDIDVRPSKVVAGLEPLGTNALLAALGKCAKSGDLDFDEAIRRTLAGDSPGSQPPPLRGEHAGSGGGNPGGSTGEGERGAGRSEARAEEKAGRSGEGGRRGSNGSKGSEGGGDGGGGARRGSGDRGGGDEEGSAKQEMEQMGAAAKAMGVPQSRRLSSRAGGMRAESKSDSLATGGLGEDPSGMGGRDLTNQIEACTGDIAVTREMLESIITRPKLSGKLLNMPPFRFLHDIVSEVTRRTGFGEGLYSGEELDSGLVKAKPAKIAYLDKLIMLVGNSLNTLVDARPAKIVAGLEAENTNRLLQLMALAAIEKPDSSRAVAVVLGSDAAPPSKRRSSSGNAGGDGDATRSSPGEREQQQQQQQRGLSEANGSGAAPGRVAESRDGSRASSEAGDAKSAGGAADSKAGSGDSEDRADIQPSAGIVDKGGEAGGGAGGGGGAGTRSMRPRTARRRPPAVRDNTQDFANRGRASIPDEPQAQPKAVAIMMDGDGDKDSDDDEIGEVERATRALPTGSIVGAGGGGANAEGGHTAMVVDILKEKERAEVRAKEADAEAKGRGGGQGGHDQKGTHDGGGGGGGIRMGRLRRASSSSLGNASNGVSKGAGGGGGGYGDADVAKLKEAIQTLCQSTHPLGKCMDFVHEDLALMSREMDRWRALHKVKAEALEAERESTETFLKPLRLQLRDLDDQLKESSMKINGVKAGISVNEKKINSLLKMVVTS